MEVAIQSTAVLPAFSRPEARLDKSLLQSADLVAVIEGHNEHTVDGKESIRRFDGMTPYAVHPIWCGTTILTEPSLPIEVRRVGSQALFYHDFHEDLTAPLPDWLSPEVRSLIDELTFQGGSDEKKEKVWSRTPVGQLCVLYDCVSNFLDRSWMTAEKAEKNAQFIRDLTQTVEEQFGALNITKIARSLTTGIAEVLPQTNPNGRGWHILPYLPEVRLSIAHLATSIQEIGGDRHYFGVLNKKALQKGQRIYGALGGAAALTGGAQREFESKFAATAFEGNDARFVIGGKSARTVCAYIQSDGRTLIEDGIEREIKEELTQEVLLTGAGAILSTEELEQITMVMRGVYQQPFVVGGDTSARQANIPSARLFFMHDLIAEKSIVDKILSHPSIRKLSEDEVASTKGGATKGSTDDGAAIANNIFLYP